MKFDAVIIGGGAAGMAAAGTILATYPEKKVALIKKEKETLVPCGIPYTLSTLDSVESDLMSTKGLESKGLEVIIDKVTRIDPETKKIFTDQGKEIEYDKVIIATGSMPVMPRIPGMDLDGIFTVPKDVNEIVRLQGALKKMNRIAVVGAGFIGMEVSDEIHKLGKNVTLIEAMDRVLPVAFDPEFSEEALKVLKDNHINVKTSSLVKEVLGNGKVEGLLLASGEKIEADGVVFSIGYRPEVSLAKEAGLAIGITGAIWTDEYMRTSVPDIFAIGDCAEHKDFFTRRASRLMLASTAAFDARVAGANLFKLRLIREIKGNIGIFSTSIGGRVFGAAGNNEIDAVQSGFDVVCGNAVSMDRHPGTIPDASKIKAKLVFSKESGVLLGGQLSGSKSVGEMTNVLGIAVQSRMTVTDLVALQVGTQPLLTASPTIYPITSAALDAYSRMHCLEDKK